MHTLQKWPITNHFKSNQIIKGLLRCVTFANDILSRFFFPKFCAIHIATPRNTPWNIPWD